MSRDVCGICMCPYDDGSGKCGCTDKGSLLMNERILELLESCQEEVWSTDWITGSPEFEGYELDTEKFAELIVRECARIADRKYLYSKEPNRWDSGFNISCEILEHFGVLK